MKRKMPAVAVACILLLGIIVYLSAAIGKKPYEDLNVSEVLSAAVRLVPPDKTVEIVELEELTGYLNDIIIYNKDNSYTKYAGQGVIFTLTMADGTQTEIMAYGSFLVIDGIGYKTEYEPSEALNNYANRLLNEEKIAASSFNEEPDTILNVQYRSDEHRFDSAAKSETAVTYRDLVQDTQTDQPGKTGEINIDENIIDVNEINRQGGDIEFADTLTYKEFLALEWTNDVDNSLADDTPVYVVKIYYPDGFEHYKVGKIENCEAIGIYRADNGEYLGGSFRKRSE